MSTSSTNGELAESASSSGRKRRIALQTAIARSPPRMPDVHVQAEGVVAPDDVAEQLVVAPVVRRVDDPLVLPAAPRMRAGRAEQDALLARERVQLRAPLGHLRGRPRRSRRSGRCAPRPRTRSARRRGAPRPRCRAPPPAGPRSGSTSSSVSGSRSANSSSTATREVGAVLERVARERELLLGERASVPRPCGRRLPAHRSRRGDQRPARAGARRPTPTTSARRPRAARPSRSALAVRGAAARAAPRASPAGRRRRRSRTRPGGAAARGYSSSSPAATSASPEWRATSGGQPAAAASAATIPNASGKIDGTTATSASGSRWTRWRCSSGPVKSVCPSGSVRASCSSARAVVAEADDHGARVEPAQRLEQQLHALVLDQLPEVDDDRPVAGEERGEPLGVALVRQPLARRCRGSAGRARASVEQRRERLVTRLRARTRRRRRPGGTSNTGSTGPTTSSSTSRMCARADEGRLRAPRATRAPHCSSRGRPRIEYSSSEPCALTRNGSPLAAPTGAPISTWFAKTRSAGSELAQRRRVRLDVARALVLGEVLQQPRLEPLVAVEHEHRQQPARQLGPHDPGAAEVVVARAAAPGRRRSRRARLDSTRARAPACRRSTRSRRAGTRARAGSSTRPANAPRGAASAGFARARPPRVATCRKGGPWGETEGFHPR